MSEQTTRPSYAGAFRCIGASCEDTCCRGWSIPVDRRTYEQYLQFPKGRLGATVAQFVSISGIAAASHHASIQLAPSGFCPFFTPDQQCGIQKEYGEALLPATCAIYPRAFNRVEGQLEGSLHLSCPEAARNILLVPDATRVEADLHAASRLDAFSQLEQGPVYKPVEYFYEIRAALIALVRDRARPLWQRVVLIGALCERLDAITEASSGNIPGILDEYRLIVERNTLQDELNALPAAVELQVQIVVRLTESRVRHGAESQRFQQTYQEFMAGIGHSPDATPAEHAQHYLDAERAFHRPFFERSPFILENYLLNYMFNTLFPFGRDGGAQTARHLLDEYIRMVTQFAWVNALLIGSAGYHKEAFAGEHVVRVVQSFSRAIEHYPYVLVTMRDYLKSLAMDNVNGMAAMLRV